MRVNVSQSWRDPSSYLVKDHQDCPKCSKILPDTSPENQFERNLKGVQNSYASHASRPSLALSNRLVLMPRCRQTALSSADGESMTSRADFELRQG
eukprot:6232727-Prymnesium_polylepis.1